MSQNSTSVGAEAPDAPFGDRSTADRFGEAARPTESSTDDGGSSGGTTGIETRDRTAASVFEEVSRDQSDDVQAVFDHFGVESPSDVMAADDDPPAAARTRNDPLVVGDAEDVDLGGLLLADRRQGEEFNWVDSGETVAVDGEAETASADAATETTDAPEPLGRRPPAGDADGDSDGGRPFGSDAEDADEDEPSPIDFEPPDRQGLLRRFVRRVTALF